MWKFRINKEESFISRIPSNQYPPCFNLHLEILENVFPLVFSGEIVEKVRNLPSVDVSDKWTQVELESAFRVVAMIYNVVVHGHTFNKALEFVKKDRVNILDTLHQLSKKVGRKPCLDYPSLVLNNYEIIDTEKPLSFDNIRVLHSFTNTESEKAFNKMQVMVEHQGRFAISAIVSHIKITAQGNGSAPLARNVVQALEDVANSLVEMKKQFAVISRTCNGEDFFFKIIPWIRAIGSDFRSPNGSQSSLIPLIDLFLNVPRKGNMAKKFMTKKYLKNLESLLGYMPPEHREILVNFKEEYSVLGYLKRVEITLTERKEVEKMHEVCLQKLMEFRSFHMAMVRHYIWNQGKKVGLDVSCTEDGRNLVHNFKGFISATEHANKLRANIQPKSTSENVTQG
eukprot:maker-scaffold_20-snap-gene-4.48-mRNA-1 protein AED:0.00 eAED:0.00 QI:297/1/1/1/1/1/2/248/397